MKRKEQVLALISALILACLIMMILLSGCRIRTRPTDNGLGTPFPTLEPEIWEALNE